MGLQYVRKELFKVRKHRYLTYKKLLNFGYQDRLIGGVDGITANAVRQFIYRFEKAHGKDGETFPAQDTKNKKMGGEK